ncbi:calcium/sodium antiporter [Aliarcobacter butzleri]|uniref:Calcium/sodium antiporter n=1 Tax=Aliarcobacter butzleri TaxID=28197 RepID=A0AAP4UZH0_9BACT|nr:calcium/sodium antiporter [Aliarcobacter butzleri]MCG3668531.1 calcium/sodium antiporter [Aliarcobacter butzleri]MCG3683406.1 calcium/sodium antiporter [Aliarcobacter butzleri]MCG3685600.1 calcium/sodium antiporter [Aliarcobacter butzleri]MCG3707253.1 calcium/sodium antiporter [Aliarcobacter butzleri]MCG3710121.1 calcium/sodium antiporter [Aliarcobacter butzleri]
MTLYLLAIIAGFALLVWSADKFVEGAAATAKHLGMPTLLIGILIVGFGTSAPEMVVSAIAAYEGNPALALGNVLGSNIVNIALILGVTALVAPIAVHSKIVKKELPLLILIVLFSGYLLIDNNLTLTEGILLLIGFFSLIGWSIYAAIKGKGDVLEGELESELQEHAMSLKLGIIWLIVGLVLLIASSRILVWGAVGVAHEFGVSDLIIGLTIVALGTSLPELAASVIAARKGEHDIAIGNVVGSNMFNLLAVIGIATVINPMNSIAPEVLYRDWIIMFILTLALLVMAYGFKGKDGKINRVEGAILVLCYVAYNAYLGMSLV